MRYVKSKGGTRMKRFSFQPAIDTVFDSALLEQDWKEASVVETIRLGKKCLYYPGMLKVRYLPYEQIQWAYLRAEENRMAVCCRRTIVDIWYLLLYADGKQVAKIEFQKKETAKKVLSHLAENQKHILIGYSEENQKAIEALNERMVLA